MFTLIEASAPLYCHSRVIRASLAAPRRCSTNETPWPPARLTIESQTNYSLRLEMHAHLGFPGNMAGRESSD